MTRRLVVVALLACCGVGCKSADKSPPGPPPPAPVSAPAGSASPAGSGSAGSGSAGSGSAVGSAAVATPPAADAASQHYVDCLASVGRKDWDGWGACYAPDAVSTFVDTGVPPVKGRADIAAKGFSEIAKAISELELHPQLILRDGDKLVAVLTLTGKHTGTLKTAIGHHAATGKPVGFYVVHVVELAAGERMIAKDWYFADVRTLLGQIGAYPDPVRPPLAAFRDPPTIVVARHDDVEKANVALYQRSVDAFNHHDAKAFDALLADDYQNIYATAPADVTKKAKLEQHTEAFRLFTDLAWKPSDTWAAGDYVVCVAKILGTNDGDFSKTTKKTGKKLDLTGVEIMRMADGKVKQHWEFLNAAALELQLGFMKPASAHAP